MVYSAGIIPFRINKDGEMEFFVGHPGGPYWEHKNYWLFLKGGVEPTETWITAAIREFKEETSLSMEDCESSMLIPLGSVIQNPHKTAIAYGLHYPNIDPNDCHSNIAPETGEPEIDKYRWMTYDELSKVTHAAHLNFYKTLIKMHEENNGNNSKG